MPMKISEVVLLERHGWLLKRTAGSHWQCVHPTKPGVVTVAGNPSAPLKPKTEVVAAGASHAETEDLMLSAMAAHIAALREAGEPVPDPSDAESVTLLDPAAA